MLANVINPKKSAFLLQRYVLNNVLLQGETIAWANQLQQDLISLKLDFQKAYDSISLEFLTRVVDRLGLP